MAGGSPARRGVEELIAASEAADAENAPPPEVNVPGAAPAPAAKAATAEAAPAVRRPSRRPSTRRSRLARSGPWLPTASGALELWSKLPRGGRIF
eukprot:4782259-Prymnesium_polylepis.1